MGRNISGVRPSARVELMTGKSMFPAILAPRRRGSNSELEMLSEFASHRDLTAGENLLCLYSIRAPPKGSHVAKRSFICWG